MSNIKPQVITFSSLEEKNKKLKSLSLPIYHALTYTEPESNCGCLAKVYGPRQNYYAMEHMNKLIVVTDDCLVTSLIEESDDIGNDLAKMIGANVGAYLGGGEVLGALIGLGATKYYGVKMEYDIAYEEVGLEIIHGGSTLAKIVLGRNVQQGSAQLYVERVWDFLNLLADIF